MCAGLRSCTVLRRRAVGDLTEARSAKGCKDYLEVTSGAIFQPYGVKIDGMPSRQEAVAP